MKRFFWIILVILISGVLYVLIHTFSKADLQPDITAIPDGVSPPRIGFENRLGEAVRIQTISHKEGMMDTTAFNDLHALLKTHYPRVFSVGEVTHFSKYSLLIHIKGKNSSLDPYLMLAHMDVVPVERASLPQWEQPPFSGAIEGGFIWGRGSMDDKSGVLGILEAAEVLLDNGWIPERDLYFSFGQDEEIHGTQGAGKVAEYFRKQGTQFKVILDEGSVLLKGAVPGIDESVALIGIAEKGNVSFELSTNFKGGHSSMPEKVTAMSRLINALENLDKNPFPQMLTTPVEGFMAYLGPYMGFTQRMAFANPGLFKPLILDVYNQAPGPRALTQTTMVPTVFHAGVKDNVIPSSASAIINLRLLPGETRESAQRRIETLVDDTLVKVRIYGEAEDPSQVSDYRASEFGTMARTVKQVFPDALIAPYLAVVATDARHFNGLSPNIYRFLPIQLESEDLSRIHGMNERLSVEGYEKTIMFYQAFMINFGKGD